MSYERARGGSHQAEGRDGGDERAHGRTAETRTAPAQGAGGRRTAAGRQGPDFTGQPLAVFARSVVDARL